jgi:hypothetical protein
MRRLALAVMTAVACGCADTGQERVTVPLFVAGTEIEQPIAATGNVQVVLERADLAFGPLVLCAGATAGDLCETARLEWLDTIVVDAISEQPVRAGDLSGVSGAVRSYMFDLGISSQLTRLEPYVLDAAAALDGASVVVAGTARIEAVAITFRAAVPIRQTDETELGVPVIRKSTHEPFSHVVGPDEPGLVVRFDPAPWIRSVDFRPYLELAPGTACSACTPCCWR